MKSNIKRGKASKSFLINMTCMFFLFAISNSFSVAKIANSFQTGETICLIKSLK